MQKVVKTLYTNYCLDNSAAAEEYFGTDCFDSSCNTWFWTDSEDIIVTAVIEEQLHRIEVVEEV